MLAEMRVTVAFMTFFFVTVSSDDGIFSFQKFRGPVSGQVNEVVIPGSHTKDYVAKPDYHYAYGVEDPVNGNSQIHKESRDGDEVMGEYQVLQADGLLRIVTYLADGKNGFRASVKYVKP